MLLATAGGGGGGGGEVLHPGEGPPRWDLTGTWAMQETVDDSACGGNGDHDEFVLELTLSGSDLTVVGNGATFYGTVSGTKVSFTGSYYDDEDDGWVTITGMDIDAQDGGNRLHGTANWNFVGEIACSGTTEVLGTRVSAGGGGEELNVAGAWYWHEVITATNFVDLDVGAEYDEEIDLEQSGQAVLALPPNEFLRGTVSGNTFELHGSYSLEGGDVTITIDTSALEFHGDSAVGMVITTVDWITGEYGYIESDLVLSPLSAMAPGPGFRDDRSQFGAFGAIALEESSNPTLVEEPDHFRLEGANPEAPERRVRLSGSGADGLLGTPDDEIGDYLAFEYDSNAELIEIHTFNGPGDDGQWLTADDDLRGYQLLDRDGTGALTRIEFFGSEGPDGSWKSADDEELSYVVITRNASGGLHQCTGYGAPGADERWGTHDDLASFHLLRRFEGEDDTHVSAGPDGRWLTPDDVVR